METLSTVTIRDYQEGEQIQAYLMFFQSAGNIMEIEQYYNGGPATILVGGWIGQECFPAKELWSDDNGFALIESPAGDVYGVQTIDLEWIKE